MTKQIGQRAELVTDTHGRQVSSRVGTYNDAITVELLKKYKGKIVTVRDITRVQYGRMTERNERYVRNRLTKAVNLLLQSGIPAFPVYESTGHHKKIGIKVVSEYNAEDYAQLDQYKEAAVTRGDLSREKADLIAKTMDSLRQEESKGNGE